MATGPTPAPDPRPHRGSIDAQLAEMRRRLLDLTGRNRLLNFRPTVGRAIQFVRANPAGDFGRIGAGQRLELTPLPEPGTDDLILRADRWERPEPADWARANQISVDYEISDGYPAGALLSLNYRDKLASRCRNLDRQARLAIEETGANMLFLVLGFLEYPALPQSDDRFCSPLVACPVQFTPPVGIGEHRWFIEPTGEEINDNLSLREKLQRDHDFGLPEIPDPEGGPAALDAYFARISEIISRRPGFVLRRCVTLCMLSFTNMLLYRDLEPGRWENPEGLTGHQVVTGLLDGGFGNDAPLLDLAEHDIEERPASQIPLVFDADSSQHSALADVLHNDRSIVIEGPPGTGKSQTITNLIAAAIDAGKSVLFVAEKQAALNVVRDRLSRAGLLPFALELHSNRSSATEVLGGLKSRLDGHFPPDGRIRDLTAKAEDARAQLRAYSDTLHRSLGNFLGLTVYELIWRIEKHRLCLDGREHALARLDVKGAPHVSDGDLRRRLEHLERLAALWTEMGPYGPDCPFWGFFPRQIIPGDDVAIADLLTDSEPWARSLARNASRLAGALDSKFGLSAEQARGHADALSSIEELLDPTLPLHLVPALLAEPQAAAVLQEMRGMIEPYLDHARTIAAGLVAETLPDAASMAAARRLGQALVASGVGDLSCTALEDLAAEILRRVAGLESGWNEIRTVGAERGWTLPDGPAGVERATVLAATADTFPEAVIHLQTGVLATPGSADGLDDLVSKRDDYLALQNEVSAQCYLDAIPPRADLVAALTTLRQSHGWIRIFRPRYRAAIGLCRGLCRKRGRRPESERLADLEAVLRLGDLEQRLHLSPGWGALPEAARSSHPDPAPYLEVARWDAQVRAAFASVEVEPPAFDTPELARGLALDLRRVHRGVVEVQRFFTWLHQQKLDRPVGTTLELTITDLAAWLRELAALARQVAPVAATRAPAGASVAQFLAALEAVQARAGLRESASRIRGEFLGPDFRGIESDVESLEQTLRVANQIAADTALTPPFRDYLSAHPSARACRLLGARTRLIGDGLERVLALKAHLSSWGRFEPEGWAGAPLATDVAAFANGFLDRLARTRGRCIELSRWAVYSEQWGTAEATGLTSLIAVCRSAGIAPNFWVDAYQYCAFRSMARSAYHVAPELGHLANPTDASSRFCEADRDVIGRRGHAIASHLAHVANPPAGHRGARVADRTEMALLNHIFQQIRPRVRVRDLISRARRSILELKPCFMMSPQSVAQYLPREKLFDLVVMDEASQLRPEEAMGAVARGGQLVVVGDPKQLPPTPFFQRFAQETETDGFAAVEAESILDVCAGALPVRRLRWHYRSKHQSLIAFSNHHFYDGNLVVLPSPYDRGKGLGVRAIYLADAVYQDQRNEREARRIVELVIEHVTNSPEDSLGVITLNSQQCKLIEDLLEAALADHPAALEFRTRWGRSGERLMVKSLENMQGDERDAIIISTTFGRAPGATVPRQNFGPISRADGWRRLNVLFTRARKSTTLVTSLRPEDIVSNADTPEGTRKLKAYLSFAKTGQLDIATETGSAAESDFEIAVGGVLRRHGFEITPQLGVAGFRIDIAVRHPDYKGAYLAAIECDGATYHSARSARDRDRIRQEILESLGWKGRIWRIWSTDWFRDPGRETGRLIHFLEELRRTWAPERDVEPLSWTEEGADVPLSSKLVAPLPTEDDESEREVEVGDTVRYCDINLPDTALSVSIARDHRDLRAGVILRSAPLAKCLLGTMCGDEPSLRVPGERPKRLRVLEIIRPD